MALVFSSFWAFPAPYDIRTFFVINLSLAVNVGFVYPALRTLHLYPPLYTLRFRLLTGYLKHTASHTLHHFHIHNKYSSLSLHFEGMKTFCCCFPSRVGVLVLSPLTCAASMTCSVISFIALIQYHTELALSQRIFLGFLGAATAVVAISSVFGFFGALSKNHSAVTFYSSALLSIWLTVVASGVLNFVFLYKNKDDFVDRCATRYEETQDLHQLRSYVGEEKWCNKVSSMLIGDGVVVFILGTEPISMLPLTRPSF